ncbi:hypothetical protein [Jiangella alkaliphila]|uniref:Antitoxin n=1 Tax=Jiangella alkaliphila TaxID=419479 RepID=A0A1H2L7M2_9ACTN|nr:hypothetical protein [Jiangella alkaliphila]SDU76824.1 hypothetical protein SAMN04488563_5328 [Jiangella alkaliphila]
MAVPEIYTVSDARKNLPALIASVAHGRMPMIGAHRRPAVALVDPTTLDVLPLLLGAHAEQTALFLIEEQGLDDEDRAALLHPGDPAGKVLAWLWRTGQHDTMTLYVADIVSYMRVKHARDGRPRLRLADLLTGIPLALPHDLPDDEAEQLVRVLRERVPGLFGQDVDAA